ncbi:hypothetical protein SKAU_G00302110 [Synaphobranchus kaupii]|uniref:Uncharacterized protein n=1 Tax=Synaphobranchus kaupii TaxID=118154 RepID=A0A9Q1IND4_SYNKA|nr:hypothetical protein SKAU_G00302110 [Synaphobranchus kaupii]
MDCGAAWRATRGELGPRRDSWKQRPAGSGLSRKHSEVRPNGSGLNRPAGFTQLRSHSRLAEVSKTETELLYSFLYPGTVY